MRCHRRPCVAIRLLKYEWNQRNTHNQHDLQAGLGASEPGALSRPDDHHTGPLRDYATPLRHADSCRLGIQMVFARYFTTGSGTPGTPVSGWESTEALGFTNGTVSAPTSSSDRIVMAMRRFLAPCDWAAATQVLLEQVERLYSKINEKRSKRIKPSS